MAQYFALRWLSRLMPMLSWWFRYQPVVDILDDAGAVSVLDVGAGSHGLSLYRPGHVVQTDLDFPAHEEFARRGSAGLVIATAERLPFRTGAFDAAISIDMVEHLPAHARHVSLQELFRVARKLVVVAFPSGPVAARQDRLLARIYGRKGQMPGWLEEHLNQTEYPATSTVVDAIPDGWTLTACARDINAWLQFATVVAETTRLQRVPRRLEGQMRNRAIARWLSRGAFIRKFHVVQRLNEDVRMT